MVDITRRDFMLEKSSLSPFLYVPVDMHGHRSVGIDQSVRLGFISHAACSTFSRSPSVSVIISVSADGEGGSAAGMNAVCNRRAITF